MPAFKSRVDLRPEPDAATDLKSAPPEEGAWLEALPKWSLAADTSRLRLFLIVLRRERATIR